MSALAQVLAPQLNWNNCRFTVQVSLIDPCSPCWELHTNSKAEALKQWSEWARRKDNSGGEWMVELFEHPKARPPTRKTYRREPRGWVYCAEFPRSKCLKRHDYMMPSLPKTNE